MDKGKPGTRTKKLKVQFAPKIKAPTGKGLKSLPSIPRNNKSGTYKKALSGSGTKETFTKGQNLLPILNARLHDEIRSLMIEPSLVYRTGRFARSVEVLNVNAKQEVMYSYLRYPYSTFEPGGRLGSVERDPRRIIDTAIRRIASQVKVPISKTERV